MSIFDRFSLWWKACRPKRLGELVAIEFDDDEVRVIALGQMGSGWNQSFRWSEITRVCFKDEGLYSSDSIHVYTADNQKAQIVLIEARGGEAFFGALTERGYFPEQTWRRAIGETEDGMHCWPPLDGKEHVSSDRN